MKKRSLAELHRNKPTGSLAHDEMSPFLHNPKTAQSNLKRFYYENAGSAVNPHIDINMPSTNNLRIKCRSVGGSQWEDTLLDGF